MTNGEIVFEGVELRYEQNVAMVNCSFTIKAGEKVGVLGRTGAGKSSIIAALFRMKDIYAGRVLIDGQDIARVNLH